jgi:hypothetical protein
VDVYVSARRSGTSSNFSGGFDNWSVGISGSGIRPPGRRSSAKAFAWISSRMRRGHNPLLINSVGISVELGDVLHGRQRDAGRKHGRRFGNLRKYFDPDGSQSSNADRQHHQSLAHAAPIPTTTIKHFVAAIDDRKHLFLSHD